MNELDAPQPASGRPDQARIAIVGGGIGGLAAAAFLHSNGLHATVYEQASTFTELGAGLVVSPNAVRLVRRLGAIERLQARAVALETGWEFRRWSDGRVLFAQEMGEECERRFGEQCYVIHRADLLEVLREAVPAAWLHHDRRIESVESKEDRAVLRFADGGLEEADVVIGADGVHSTVGRWVAEAASARYSGLCAFRSLVPAERAPSIARRPVHTLWIGPGRHAVHYPISSGRLINIVAITPANEWTTESWSALGDVRDLRREFTGWAPELCDLLEAVDETRRWALLERDPLDRWVRGRVALLGDAAHPMLPFQAQGAGQAIEDAAVVAHCLAEETGTPARALLRYEALRRDRATAVQLASRGRADLNHLPDGPAQQARDAAMQHDDPLGFNGWIYEFDALAAPGDAVVPEASRSS